MKSTLFNMVAVLFTITLIASAGVGAVNMITEDAMPRLTVRLPLRLWPTCSRRSRRAR